MNQCYEINVTKPETSTLEALEDTLTVLQSPDKETSLVTIEYKDCTVDAGKHPEWKAHQYYSIYIRYENFMTDIAYAEDYLLLENHFVFKQKEYMYCTPEYLEEEEFQYSLVQDEVEYNKVLALSKIHKILKDKYVTQ